MARDYHEWIADLSVRPEWPLGDAPRRKIREFQALPDGWHSGEGIAIEYRVAEFADQLYTILNHKGFSYMDVFPRPNGGVEFHVYGSCGHIELFIDPKHTFDYLKNDIHDEITEQGEDLPWERAIPLIVEFFKEESMSFGQSPPSLGTSQRSIVFLLTHSQTPLTVQVYPSSMSLVPLLPVAPSAHILRNTTQVRSAILQHT